MEKEEIYRFNAAARERVKKEAKTRVWGEIVCCSEGSGRGCRQYQIQGRNRKRKKGRAEDYASANAEAETKEKAEKTRKAREKREAQADFVEIGRTWANAK